MDWDSGNGWIERGELWSTMCHQTVWCLRVFLSVDNYIVTPESLGRLDNIGQNILGKLGILRSGICAGSHFEKTSSSACIQAVLLLSWTMRVSFRCINLSVNASSSIYRVNHCHTLLLQRWVWTKARDSGLGFGKDSITARQELSSSAPTTQRLLRATDGWCACGLRTKESAADVLNVHETGHPRQMNLVCTTLVFGT